MKPWRFWVCLAAGSLVWAVASPALAGPAEELPVVRAILFYSPTCPHCHQVISNDLPPLLKTYGDRLQIVGVDASTPGGQALFQAAVEAFEITPERRVVPLLIVGEVILLGSIDIPQQLPGLVDALLAKGGVDWPDIPGLSEALAQAQSGAAPTGEPPAPPATPTVWAEADRYTPLPGASVSGSATPSPEATQSDAALILADQPQTGLGQRLALDPAGNTLAILVLIGLVGTAGGGLFRFLTPGEVPNPAAPSLAIPILSLLGLLIAAYLAFVETARVEAVCGPVGDCNTVQQSEYARLFGFLPIGVLGMAGYFAVLLAWLMGRFWSGEAVHAAKVALLGMAAFGTLFSIYLTFLEPFVIGATCAWCLTSAVIMAIILWLAIGPGKSALAILRQGASRSRRQARIGRSSQLD